MGESGCHYLIDLVIEDGALLKDEIHLAKYFAGFIESSSFNALGFLDKKFTSGGEGVTGLFLLSESHLSYHTFPENNYISLDLYTCGDQFLKESEIDSLVNGLGIIKQKKVTKILRGIDFLKE